jgi:GT2 family glycosyltransferase
MQNYHALTIIVCDDGSTDGTLATIRRQYPEVILLRGDGDLWWSGATNLCIEFVLSHCQEHDLVLVLNNDVQVTSGYLKSLVDIYSKYPESLIGSLSVNVDEPEKVAFAGIRWNRFLARWRPNFGHGTSLQNIKKDVIESDALPGRGMLVPSRVFKEIGLFDKKHMPQYGADYDFSLRAKKAGYRLLVSCQSVVYSDIENKGYHSYLRDFTMKTFFKSYFSRKSPRNLSSRFWLGVKHIPWFYFPIYFVIDEARFSGSFIRSFIKAKMSRNSPKGV